MHIEHSVYLITRYSMKKGTAHESIEHFTEIIIFYHPNETLNEDGSISFSNGEHLYAFAETAAKYGITGITKQPV